MKWALIASLLLLPKSALSVERFALVVGNDRGAAVRPRLWFASRDAVRFSRTLVELGKFPEDHIVLLTNESAGGVRQAMQSLDARIQKARTSGENTLLFFYFSGHANADALELGSEQLGYAELRDWISHSQAHARIAMVDSCGAGELTQVKGGRFATVADFPVRPDERVEGVAYVASTALGELAQESAALEGSFFTSYFVVAMRGAGDLDGDGQVTLSEAFRYTAGHTTANTALTTTGPQHPTYDFRLSGRGDVVLTDLRQAEASVKLPPADGSLYVVRGPNRLLSEIPGLPHPQQLALPAGRYTVDRRRGTKVESVEVVLTKGEQHVLPPFGPAREISAATKGGDTKANTFGAGASVGALASSAPMFAGHFAHSRPIRDIVGRVHLSLGGGTGTLTGGRSYSMFSLGVSLGALRPLVQRDSWQLSAGLEAGTSLHMQRLSEAGTWLSPDFVGNGVLSLMVPIGNISVGPELAFGGRLLSVDHAMAVRPFVAGSLLVSVHYE